MTLSYYLSDTLGSMLPRYDWSLKTLRHLCEDIHLPEFKLNDDYTWIFRPLPFVGDLPTHVRALKYTDINDGDNLIAVGVDCANRIFMGNGTYFCITSAPRMSEFNIGHVVDTVGSMPLVDGIQFLKSLGIPIDGRHYNKWRTFHWSEETEAYLRDLVKRQAFAEYLALISPDRIFPTEAPVHIPASLGALGGGSATNVANVGRRVGSVRVLQRRFINQRLMARIRENAELPVEQKDKESVLEE